ncbi:MAG: caspase family protein [Cyanobacteria bacterium P01_B01_bin.77]
MDHTLYALIVGINDYPNPVPKLSGCVNDVNALSTFLQNRIANDNLQVQLRTLIDEAATREGIIDIFREHLGQATQNDLVLFSYSGHGSQERTPPELSFMEPDGMNETLVCWDSRLDSGRDLADKELAKLIAEVAENRPQITVILDCCHSGSGTRPINIRYVEPDERQRPVESYFFSMADVLSSAPSPERSEEPLKNSPFQGRHVLLAACHESETAKEYRKMERGAFSYFLLETLQQANGVLTYRDAFRRTNALIRAQVPQQSPQLEATYEEDLDLYFLSWQKQITTPYYTMSYHSELGWVIDGGAIHGMSTGLEEERPQMAVFPFEISANEMKQLDRKIALAEVIKVLPQLSLVTLTEGLDSTQAFKAVVTRLPLTKLGVYLEGREADVIWQALLKTSLTQQPSLYVKAVDVSEKASFQVVAENGIYQITDLNSFQPLAGRSSGCRSAIQVVARLEHMARWTTLVNLSGPATSQIPTGAVQMQLYQQGQEVQTAQIELRYEKKVGRWQQPQFQLKLTNTWSLPLYCSVLDLTERYAISPAFFEANGVWLQPGESAWANGGKPLYTSVPKELWQQGVTEYRDIYKLIFSTAEFDTHLLTQPNLDAPLTRSAVNLSQVQPNVLNRLMHRLHTRDVSTAPEEEALHEDWNTHQMLVITVRPLT